MAIAEMRKLNLIAMSYDKGVILDALQRTGAVEVKLHADTENTSVPPVCGDELRSYLASAEAALSVLCSEVENYNRENNIKSGILKDGFEVTYTDFMSAREKKGEIDSLIARINRLTDEKNALKARLSRIFGRRKMQSSMLLCRFLSIPSGIRRTLARGWGRFPPRRKTSCRRTWNFFRSPRIPRLWQTRKISCCRYSFIGTIRTRRKQSLRRRDSFPVPLKAGKRERRCMRRYWKNGKDWSGIYRRTPMLCMN